MFLSSNLKSHSLSEELSMACLENKRWNILFDEWFFKIDKLFPYFLVSKVRLTPFLLKTVKEGKAARGFSCISAAFTFDHLRADSVYFDNHQADAHTDPKFIFSSINFLSLFFSLAFVFSFLAILTPRFLKNFLLKLRLLEHKQYEQGVESWRFGTKNCELHRGPHHISRLID